MLNYSIMIYIKRVDNRTRQREVVDSAEDRNEANYLLAQYRLSDDAGSYYLSRTE